MARSAADSKSCRVTKPAEENPPGSRGTARSGASPFPGLLRFRSPPRPPPSPEGADEEGEVAGPVAFFLGDGEGEVEGQGELAEGRDDHADTGPHGGAEGGERVVGLDGAEVAED